MTVNLPHFLLALLLLWFPRYWLRLAFVWLTPRRKKAPGPKGRYVEPWRVTEPGDQGLKMSREFTRVRNYVDLVRGAVGALLLVGGLGIEQALVRIEGARGGHWQILAVQTAVLLIGLLIQTVRFERGRVTFSPPIFYLAGLSVGLCSWRAAGFAFVLIWAMNGAMPNAQVFLTVYSLLLVVFGVFFGGRGNTLAILAGGLCFLPVLMSLLSRRPLVVLSRRGGAVE